MTFAQTEGLFSAIETLAFLTLDDISTNTPEEAESALTQAESALHCIHLMASNGADWYGILRKKEEAEKKRAGHD